MSHDVLCRYATDADGRLVSVDAAWCEFAQANGAPEYAEPDRLYGLPLLSFISDTTTKHVYSVLMQRVIDEREPVRIPFRCDAPALRRWMELTMTVRAGGGIDFVSRQLRAEPRIAPLAFDRAPLPHAPMLRMCSWCKNVELPRGRWDTLEQAVRELGLFGERAVPDITHGICPPCQTLFELDVRR